MNSTICKSALVTLTTLGLCWSHSTTKAAQRAEYDVVIYGGTSAAVTAAVQAVKMKRSVVIVCPDKHLGGLSSGGLGYTDTGNKAVIGGLSREFYHRVWKHYQSDDAWQWQKREEYGNKGQGTAAIDGKNRTMWIFEPHVAEQAFDEFISDYKIPVLRDEWLDRANGVTKADGRIAEIRMLSGKRFRGKMFIDATYEGDLMAVAGVSYHVGREAESVYGEKWNGIRTSVKHHGHWFKKPVDPYVKPGDPSSGLLARISRDPPGTESHGDKRIQAYCFRMCLSRNPDNRVPFPKPNGYDASQYALLARVFETGWRETFNKFDPIPNLKTDTNNHGPFSTDNIGRNYDYPEGSYERRREIIAEHEQYQKGFMYFLANDERVPADVRKQMAIWGLAKDEFKDNGNWPHQIYVREARRMIGHYVMTEHDCLGARETPECVGMGSYTMDSHNVQRYVTPDGLVQNEGDIGVRCPPYEISYGSLVPKKAECENLLVPVAVSSSHIAFGSIRMEPVFMILGQSAATAASMSIEQDIAVQDLEYDALKTRLIADGQVLEYAGSTFSAKSLNPKALPGIVIDDVNAKLTGDWSSSTSTGTFVGSRYLHDGNKSKGEMQASFVVKIEQAGTYEVRLAYTPNPNRASNVPVTVTAGSTKRSLKVNQKKTPPIDKAWVSLGVYKVGRGETVTAEVSNVNTDGYVIVDAVQVVPDQK